MKHYTLKLVAMVATLALSMCLFVTPAFAETAGIGVFETAQAERAKLTDYAENLGYTATDGKLGLVKTDNDTSAFAVLKLNNPAVNMKIRIECSGDGNSYVYNGKGYGIAGIMKLIRKNVYSPDNRKTLLDEAQKRVAELSKYASSRWWNVSVSERVLDSRVIEVLTFRNSKMMFKAQIIVTSGKEKVATEYRKCGLPSSKKAIKKWLRKYAAPVFLHE